MMTYIQSLQYLRYICVPRANIPCYRARMGLKVLFIEVLIDAGKKAGKELSKESAYLAYLPLQMLLQVLVAKISDNFSRF